MSSDQNWGRGRGRGQGGPRGGGSRDSGRGDGQSGGQRGGQSGGQRGGQWDGQSGSQRGGGDYHRDHGGSYERGRSASGGGDRGTYRGRGGDSRGRGGPRRSDSPLQIDVRTIAKTVKIKSEFVDKNKGTNGTKVELIANHFPIQESVPSVCHYDIDIKLRRRDGKESMPKPEQKRVRNEKQMENKQIIDKMVEEWPESGLRPNTYAYDGNKNLFTVDELNIGSEQVSREVTVTLDGFPEQIYDVKIQFVRNIAMDVFDDEFADSRQVMDIVLRDRMQRSLVGVGRNLFNREDPQNTIQLERENCSIAFGHHQSIQKTESGLTLNVDRITTIFRGEGPLIDFIKRELNVENFKSVRFDEQRVRFLTSRLRDMKIYTNHIIVNGVPQKRKSGIESMTGIKPYEHSFETEPGVRKTLEQYFHSKYGITLLYREVPLIKIKGGTRDNPKYLPAEICHVYPNQTLPKPLINPDIQRQIVEATNTQTPLKRFEKIQNSLETITQESQALMDAFGLKIIPHPIKMEGRQLPTPKVDGNAKRLKETVELKHSLFLNLSFRAQRDLDENFDNFFNNPNFPNLIATAREMGLKVALPRKVGIGKDISTLEAQMETFESVIKSVKKVYPLTQYMFVCIPYVPELYEWIKHLSENVYGVMTQCIKDELFMRTKPGYFNNFLLKTNAKLNGQNQALVPRQFDFRPQLLTDPNNNTMIVGADVTHPGIHNPLVKERVISSIAAVVGSYDSDFTKFLASVSAVGMNCEFITDFGVMFENILKGFFNKNKKIPKNIVFFRDGVSDSQLNDVLNGEIPQIEKVYEMLRLKKVIPMTFKPMITAYVVQKRHHTRIFQTQPSVDRNKKENFNMKSGTVVDHTITNPDLNEYHLCSHTGRLGTSRHAKYVVLRNDHNLSKDQLQMLSFSMCFTYCRCQTPISIPIPVKYADLAAYRAKQHTAAQNTSFEAGNRNETEDQKKEREAANIRKLNQTMVVHPDIKVLPYYC